jgi:hypothetical protein
MKERLHCHLPAHIGCCECGGIALIYMDGEIKLSCGCEITNVLYTLAKSRHEQIVSMPLEHKMKQEKLLEKPCKRTKL